ARVESLTNPDEIMISNSVYEDVRKTDDILCRYADQTKVKGKEEPIEVYRVVWGDEDSITGLTRSAATAEKMKKRKRKYARRLEVDISREGETLRITAAEKTEKTQSSIRPYEEMQITVSKIEERCKEITDLLNRANTRGKVSKDILSKLRDVGQVLFDDLLTAQAKEMLRSASVDDLIFHIEDSLVQIPWELLHDGEQFLCQKFNMGRLVKTKQSVVNIKQRNLSRPLKMLIVSDPRGDLENAFQEGETIREQLDSNPSFISANQKSRQITSEYIMEKIRNFDLMHYAGHADYDPEDPSNSGWLLDGGKLTSSDIMKLVGGRPMPALVFCNACQSGQTEEWKIGASYNQKIFGLANAFLLSGVQHYVGTFWEILDEPGAHFAVEFYRAMMQGASIGEAMREARMFLIKEYGEDTIVWASYMLYGDPGFNYFEFAEEEEEEAEAGAASKGLGEAAQLRSTPSETVSFEAAQAPASTSKMVVIGAALVVLALAVIFLFTQRGPDTQVEKDPYLLAYSQLQKNKIETAKKGFEGLAQDNPQRFEGLAAVAYKLGDYDSSLQMVEKALEIAPYNLYTNVIKGNILFSQGKLDEALTGYEKAANIKDGINWQQAEALNGIARIYSEKGESEKSV
ncbi:MAG: CHAT domain-containing protein, partial [Deltaproteobacteria bacterium]|nr:CHAT domain-containing protein [Deltaproteobacteria bacterium]